MEATTTTRNNSYKMINIQLLQKWIQAVIEQELQSLHMDKGMRHMIEKEFCNTLS